MRLVVSVCALLAVAACQVQGPIEFFAINRCTVDVEPEPSRGANWPGFRVEAWQKSLTIEPKDPRQPIYFGKVLVPALSAISLDEWPSVSITVGGTKYPVESLSTPYSLASGMPTLFVQEGRRGSIWLFLYRDMKRVRIEITHPPAAA